MMNTYFYYIIYAEFHVTNLSAQFFFIEFMICFVIYFYTECHCIHERKCFCDVNECNFEQLSGTSTISYFCSLLKPGTRQV